MRPSYSSSRRSPPGRSQDHVRQSGINSGNHTAIPTPKIDILAGVTLTHFTLKTFSAAARGWYFQQFRKAVTHTACASITLT
jgi:hypothetical protein